jgi:hypothetical protein
MEERAYQGYIYRRSGPGAEWKMVGPAQRGQVITDPYRAAEEQRKGAAEERAREDQRLQEQRYGLDVRGDERREASEAITNPQTLRKEYAALPEIKAFKVASQMASQALGTAANPQGDIALTYAFAKVMDPESVVRDQEANMVTNSQPWFQSAVENIKKQFGMDGAGNFTPEARARLRDEIVRAVASRKPLYEARRNEMVGVARANGIDPGQVVGQSDTEVFAPAFREYAVKYGDPSGAISSFLGEQIARPENMQAAGAGATTEAIPIPPEMQQEHAAYLQQNWGRLDPQDYAAFRINLDRKYNFGSNPEGYAKSATELNKDAAAGRLPTNAPIPSVERELSTLDRIRNDLVSNPAGAAVAGGLNAGGFGIPSLLAPAEMQALREANPASSFAGDVAGGVGGTALAGTLLRGAAGRMGAGGVADILANPMTADVAYGSIYGATQADDPLYGAVAGGVGAAAGNRVGRVVGEAFPGITGVGPAMRRANESVPTSRELRDQAGELYNAAEATGEQIAETETFALADRVANVLSAEGRLGPTGRLTEVQPKVKEAYQLVQDYAGEPMTPKQVQTVRKVIGDAVTSKDADERRIARLLMGEFDDWTAGAAPQMAETLGQARGVSQRYLQGDELAMARDLADVRAGQFSQSGLGNALRTDFRQLDRRIARGDQNFSPEVETAIADVARGTPSSNAMRFIGRFAPMGPMSSLPYVGMVGGGAASADPLLSLGGVGLAGLTYGARQAEEAMAERAAQQAINRAYGGPEYGAVLDALMESARQRGARAGAALGAETSRAGMELR